MCFLFLMFLHWFKLTDFKYYFMFSFILMNLGILNVSQEAMPLFAIYLLMAGKKVPVYDTCSNFCQVFPIWNSNNDVVAICHIKKLGCNRIQLYLLLITSVGLCLWLVLFYLFSKTTWIRLCCNDFTSVHIWFKKWAVAESETHSTCFHVLAILTLD